MIDTARGIKPGSIFFYNTNIEDKPARLLCRVGASNTGLPVFPWAGCLEVTFLAGDWTCYCVPVEKLSEIAP